jgi:hypothetical protein
VDAAPRAVREYLDTLDEAAFGAASEVKSSLPASLIPPVSGLLHAKALHSFAILTII